MSSNSRVIHKEKFTPENAEFTEQQKVKQSMVSVFSAMHETKKENYCHIINLG